MSNSEFVKIEGGSAVVIRAKQGTYHQVPVYLRGEHVYVKMGGGYIRCYASGSTSSPLYRVDDIDPGDYALGMDSLGRVVVVMATETEAKQGTKQRAKQGATK